MNTAKILLIIVFLTAGLYSFSQSRLDSILGKVNPEKWAAAVEKKSEKLAEKIIAKSQKTLTKLQRQEEKIYKRMLRTKDSMQAKAALADIQGKYQTLQDRIKNPGIASGAKPYIPKLDSLGTALKFLDQNGMARKVKGALAKTESLQDKFQQAEEVKKFIRERRQQLKDQLEKLGMTKHLKKINKEVYYYSAQINEYKEVLKDSKKAERKALELLGRTKLFKDFMRKNSMLASLFRMPGDPNDPATQANLSGLQTRAQVNGLIQQQLSAGGQGAQQQFRENMQAAQSQIQQLKSKLSQYGGGSSDDIMPEGFKPSGQKTKSFWRQLEYGTNVQTQKSNGLWPVTSDLGLSVGYKLSDKSIVGIGASYKLGWGHNFRNMKITQEGAGLRSFIDWKIKGSFWVSGGYEANYRTVFNSVDQLKDMNVWSQSGLVGMSKVISVRSKFFKKTKLQLLWDFLSYQQIPKTQPVVFRVGYNF